jgi:hypothetical protein
MLKILTLLGVLLCAAPVSAQVQTEVGNLTKDTSGVDGATQTVTGVAFEPKAGIFILAGPQASGGVFGSDHWTGIGIADDDGGQAVMTAMSDHNSASSNTARAQSSNLVVLAISTGGSTIASASVAFTSDGFTLTWVENTDTTAYRVLYYLIGGSDITGTDVVAWNSNSSTGNQSVTSVGFQPDFLFNLGGMGLGTTDPGSTSNRANMGVGFATTAASFSTSWASFDGVGTSDTYRYQRFDKFITGVSATTGTVFIEATLVQMLSNGFQVNWSVTNGQYRQYTLAIQGGRHAIGVDTQRNDGVAGTKTISGLSVGDPVKGFLTASYGFTAQTTVQAEAELALGFTDENSTDRTFWSSDLDNSADTVSVNNWRSGPVMVFGDPTGPTAGMTLHTTGSPTTLSETGGDVEIFWTANTESSLEFGYWAIGNTNDPPAAGGGKPCVVGSDGMVRRCGDIQ